MINFENDLDDIFDELYFFSSYKHIGERNYKYKKYNESSNCSRAYGRSYRKRCHKKWRKRLDRVSHHRRRNYFRDLLVHKNVKDINSGDVFSQNHWKEK